MSDSIVIIPTYNELENIDKMVKTLMELPKEFDILFIDDNSPDGTSDAIAQQMELFPNRIFLEKRAGKLGLGTAYIHGFNWSLKRNYEFIFEMDCDFSHDPADLIHLYETCKNGSDLSIGSRYVTGGKVKNWPWDRILMSYFASVYVRLILWISKRYNCWF